MAQTLNFRSAFNGFNREDVVHYLEYINARHDAQVAQLQGELQNTQPAAEAPTEELEALRERIAQLEEENKQLKEAQPDNQPSEEDTEELRRQLAQVTKERDEARKAAARSRTDEELAAYRRAERTERVARERVTQLYHQANGAMADAGAELETAADSMNQAADQAAAHLGALLDTIARSRNVLRQAAAGLTTLAPEEME